MYIIHKDYCAIRAMLLWTVGPVLTLVGFAPFSECFADMTTLIVSMSAQNLSSVPQNLPLSTEALDLTHNHIASLRKGDFVRTPRLKFLNLSGNVLWDIDKDTFTSTPLLEVLDLSGNRLQSLMDQQYLLQTQSLKYLDLTFNCFVNMTLGAAFGTLRKLEHLGLGAEVLRTDDFQSIYSLHLQNLKLHLENLRLYENGSLKNVSSEVTIAVTNKMTLDLEIFKDALTGFTTVGFTGIATNVQWIWERMHKTINARTIQISNMTSTWAILTNTINFFIRSSVRSISISDTTLHEMGPNRLLNTHLLDYFSIRRPSVTVFLFDQRVLYDSIINLDVLNLTFAQSPIVHMTCPQQQSLINSLDLSDGALSERVFSQGSGRETQECKTLVNLETLVLRGNNLQNLQPLSCRVRFMGLLGRLDLSQNKLSYQESQGTCFWPRNLRDINLASNDFQDSVFRCLPLFVVKLDLQNNNIARIPVDILALESLAFLDLSVNRLQNIPHCRGFPNLMVLHVRENSLHSPSPHILRTCPALKVLDASQNNYICTCSLTAFTSLARGAGTSKVKLLHWPRGYQCNYPESWNGTLLRDFSLPAVSCSAPLLAAAILVPAITLVLAVVMLCRQLDAPWYLGMIWRWTRAKHRSVTSQDRPEELEGVCFHAFVSYSQRNAEWVKGQLLPKLEGASPGQGLHICHHERDFVPGKTIVQNILRCMEMSRRCIFVLSSHFVQSEWCHYELYFASHQRVARGSDSVVLVLLEPLPLYLIPSKYFRLKSMMASHTYLEWPQEAGKQRLFWANLRAALQADLPVQPDGNREM
ncbi:toll-like receptor 1 [Denticeps clupeoides]|uniref:TIR domain-containing protein n=1 Tax=Denticeps clupeoides TaxID=299321 RepID=A0AAY4E7M5_9TELE|nr:toll-like receptor 6 [Denticeps clupeoides]